MSKLKNALIVGGGVLLLGSIGALTNSNIGALHAADTGPVVTIGSPLPLPTTAAQNGAWSVGITGTPNVNVANTPGVNINNTPNVSITGTPTVQDRDSQARNFYQNVLSNNCTGTPCVVAFPAVPAGKRLIVQQVSAVVAFNSAGASAPVQIELRGANVFQFLPITPAPANFPNETQYLAHAGVLAAYDGGQNPEVDAFVPNNSSYTALASISGYMIDIP